MVNPTMTALPTEDGWQIEDGIAEWWDGDDAPKLVIRLPVDDDFVMTRAIRRMIEDAFNLGRERGESYGRIMQQHEIRRALGL